ncbi:MAG: ADP-ribosylglycohydrolase family protein [Duodenibacillus sp.]|nr:ADP-ribosylglycohydrolase family protein [Duodenibacillus sp.]
MIGALVGDIVGSRFEFDNFRSKSFALFAENCSFTDDSVMSLALCDALAACEGDWSSLGARAVQSMQSVGRHYPFCGYGGRFHRWIFSGDPKPYNSWGNGSAMRVSGCIWAARSLEEAKLLSRIVTEVTHNHEEGIKGAEATAVAGFMALHGSSRDEIRDYVASHYYPLDFTLDAIRDTYRFNESCQGTVPQAIEAFLEGTSFEDAIRGAVSIGGDSDTLAAITGGIAEAFWGVPDEIRAKALAYLDERLAGILARFEAKWPGKRA